MNRRELLRNATAMMTAAAVQGLGEVQAAPQGGASDTSGFFPGFKESKVKTSGATIHVVTGGQGPPVLLLHGAPQSHISWRLVAPKLAGEYTVVVPDLRGYGDST